MTNFTLDLVNKIEEYIGDFKKKFEDQVNDVCLTQKKYFLSISLKII